MQTDLTVVISCAGTGSRLGLGMTKALVEVHGRPLIAWQLALLESVADVRIVIGHEAKRVIDVVRSLRPDALFVMNSEYKTTGTAASLSLAIRGVDPKSDVISLDGDLLVDPESFKIFLGKKGARLGLVQPASSEPVFALVNEMHDLVTGFAMDVGSRGAAKHEWSGLCRVPASELICSIKEGVHRRHVYEMLAPRLPMPFQMINAQEIDTPDDFERALTWLSERRAAWNLKERE